MTTDKYRNPIAYTVDVEVMANVTNATARRIMARIKKHFGIPGKQHPTIIQVKQFLQA